MAGERMRSNRLNRPELSLEHARVGHLLAAPPTNHFAEAGKRSVFFP